MRHEPSDYQYLGSAMRQARNRKHYKVLHLRCPICGREVRPLDNAWRGRALKCAGGK